MVTGEIICNYISFPKYSAVKFCMCSCSRERTIAIYRSSDSYVVQSRSWLPDAVGGVIWFGPGAAHGTVYTPVLAGMTRAPDTLSYGWQGVFNTSTAFWANRRVLNYAQVKFSYMIEHIRAVQDCCETESVRLVDGLSDTYNVGNTADTLTVDVLNMVESVFEANANKATFEMNRLLDALFFTYPDGYKDYWDESGFHSTSLGYPVWWLEAGNYVDGPPDVEAVSTLARKNLKRKESQLLEAFPVSLNLISEKIPGIASSKFNEGLPVHGLKQTVISENGNENALRKCVSACGEIVELSQYRQCTTNCLL